MSVSLSLLEKATFLCKRVNIEGSGPGISQLYNMLEIYHFGPDTLISRVSNQNGVSLLYIEGSRPEWCISTIYHA